jgi:hypothetical protein
MAHNCVRLATENHPTLFRGGPSCFTKKFHGFFGISSRSHLHFARKLMVFVSITDPTILARSTGFLTYLAWVPAVPAWFAWKIGHTLNPFIITFPIRHMPLICQWNGYHIENTDFGRCSLSSSGQTRIIFLVASHSISKLSSLMDHFWTKIRTVRQSFLGLPLKVLRYPIPEIYSHYFLLISDENCPKWQMPKSQTPRSICPTQYPPVGLTSNGTKMLTPSTMSLVPTVAALPNLKPRPTRVRRPQIVGKWSGNDQ